MPSLALSGQSPQRLAPALFLWRAARGLPAGIMGWPSRGAGLKSAFVLPILLSHHYAQTINALDLSVIQRHFSPNDPSDRVWNHEDLQRLLRDLIHEKQERLSAYGRYQSIIAEWHDMMEWLNDLLPGENHVMVSIEDSVPNFVHRLWDKYFDAETIYGRDQSPQDVIWLGKLALLHLDGAWWERPDGMHFFYQLVEDHNELFGFY